MLSSRLEKPTKNKEELLDGTPRADGGPLMLPSDKWSAFSDSVLSSRHLGEDERSHRGSNLVLTVANVCKLYVGIAFLSAGKSIS